MKISHMIQKNRTGSVDMILFTKPKDYSIEFRAGTPAMPNAHYHSTYELYYLDAGNRTYLVDDKFFSITAGDFVLIKPYVIHRTTGGYSLRTLIDFSLDFLQKTYTPAATKHWLKCFDNVTIHPPETLLPELKNIMLSMSKTNNPIDFASDLGMLLRKLSQCTPDNQFDKRMSTVINYIHQNFSEIQSIDEIAEQLYISKYHLSKLFKEATGTTLIDYLNSVKIKNACEYLKTTNKNMMEIANICGFNEPAYFSNVFHKVMRISPTEYRKKEKNKLSSSSTNG